MTTIGIIRYKRSSEASSGDSDHGYIDESTIMSTESKHYLSLNNRDE